MLLTFYVLPETQVRSRCGTEGPMTENKAEEGRPGESGSNLAWRRRRVVATASWGGITVVEGRHPCQQAVSNHLRGPEKEREPPGVEGRARQLVSSVFGAGRATPTATSPWPITLPQSPLSAMNATVLRPWYATVCVPYLSIEGCPSDTLQARRVWAGLYLAFDISAFLFLLATLIRRFVFVQERFNTIRLMLVLFVLGNPLCVLWRVLP